MRLVLVTGAGASRDLGKEEPLPLMDTWSNLLCEALDRRESNLAAAIGLKPGLSGPDFERALGDFLRWQDMRHLEAKFAGLGGPHPGSSFGEQQRARENQDGRVEAVTRVLRASLFDNFGAHRVDSKRAASAYGGLLDKVARDISLVCATTNYDLSLGMALRDLGHTPHVGFAEDPFGTPRLYADGLVDWETNHSERTAVLHLHGAVGWYESNGEVLWRGGDQPYNDTLGVPVILYPDPDKDPTRDSIVQSLWREFRKALDDATHVLVIGHSLNDPALNEQLKRNVSSVRLGWCLHDPDEHGSSEAERQALTKTFPSAIPIDCQFGPEPLFEVERLSEWIG